MILAKFFQKNTKALFILMPLLFIVAGLYIKSEMPAYFFKSVDPEYAYLLNALNIDNFQFPHHIDHPGTPLQLFSAIVIFIVHIFHNPGVAINADVFTNPELFIRAIIVACIFLHAIIIFIVGLTVFKIRKSIPETLFIQAIPFTSTVVLTLSKRLMVEQFLISFVLLFLLLLIKHVRDMHENKPTGMKRTVLFALAIGVGTATKITIAPFFFIPLFFLGKIQTKLIYSALCLAFFAFFAMPIFNHWVGFRDWIEGLFIHSGHYATGSPTVIDPQQFYVNLLYIITAEPIFIISLAMSAMAFIWFKIQKTGIKTAYIDKQIIIALAAAQIIYILMVAKQTKFYYLAPNIMLSAGSLIFSIYPIINSLSSNYRIIARFLSTAIVLAYILKFTLLPIYTEHDAIIASFNTYRDTEINLLKSKRNAAKLIVAEYYGAPYKEYGIFFGTAWCGEKMRNMYAKSLLDAYPSTYFYHGWNNLFNHWNAAYLYVDLLKKYRQAELYFGSDDMKSSVASKIFGINRQFDTKFELLYQNKQTNECIFNVTFDSAKHANSNKYYWNFDNIDSLGQYVDVNGIRIPSLNLNSSEYAISGMNACKIMSTPLKITMSEAELHDSITISVWRKVLPGNNSGIEISAADTVLSVTQTSKMKNNTKTWEQLHVRYAIDSQYVGKDIVISLKNYSASTPTYFDNLEIEISKSTHAAK